jgi:O-acetyl-ADP-ribose deacetylase (regulator of RNase III)
MMREINGNILTANAEIICHQTNCFSQGVSGLAKSIFEKFPVSNTYRNRTKGIPELFGTCSYHKADPFWICNMYAQMYPSVAQSLYNEKAGSYVDDAKERLAKFNLCLEDLAAFCQEYNLTEIAFPYKISCGLAGGAWVDYKKALVNFSQRYPDFNIQIINPFL